ncbi:MAG: hypothetical protein V3T17_06045 [Pseudomonadales bacterium]
MSTAVIVGFVTIGLFVLVTFAVTMQTIEKNNKERRRRESALNSRARNFQYMLDGFPQNFLNRDLQVLVCKSLVEVYTQLSQLDPKNKIYSGHQLRIQQQLEQYKTKPARSNPVTLIDSAQIKDIQKLLTSLHTFIAKLMESKRINTKEAKIYSQQIHKLMVQTTTDSLAQAINQALQSGKSRLAIHYLQMSVDKMQKENGDGLYTDRISNYQQRIAELDSDLESSDANAKQRRADADAEWDEINKPDDAWKKKALYD